MLITNDFVMLNYPKTGSSFARAVIKKILDKRQAQRPAITRFARVLCGLSDYREIILPNIKITGTEKTPDQHGSYSQIPKKYLNKKVVSVARNPVSRIVSTYEFKSWQKLPLVPVDILISKFPNWPDLSFEEYLNYTDEQMIYGRLSGVPPKAFVGNQTIQFIQMFFKDPNSIIENITDEYIDSDDFINDVGAINFITQEDLVADLSDFLAVHGYSPEEVAAVRCSETVNVTEERTLGINHSISEDVLRKIADRDRLLYKIYRYFGIGYKCELIRR